MADLSCPKCQGPRDAKALYCPFCGVVFARYVAGPAPSPSPGAPAVPEAKSSPFAPNPSPFAPNPSPFAPDSSPFAPDSSPFAPSSSLPSFEDRKAPVAETLYGGPPPPSGDAPWNPYQAPSQISPYAPYRASSIDNQVLASRLSRLGAQWLNGFAFGGLLILSLVPGFLLATQSRIGSMVALIGGIAGLVYWIHINLKLLGMTGQSYGKKWMGIKIVRTSGEQAAVSHLVVKRFLFMQLIGLVPYAGGFVGLIDVLMIFGKDQRCLHDHFADTKVVIA